MIVIRKTLLALLAVALISAGTTLTQAQRQTYRGTNSAVRQLILRLQNRTTTFRNALNAQKQNRVYGTNGGDLLNRADDLDRAVVQLQQRFDRRQ